ncbi:MAG: hypothetical protein GQ558_04795 [Thermoplasmata archaeon]|nr:hypothetical protein [Thermoplasmata archaeon]
MERSDRPSPNIPVGSMVHVEVDRREISPSYMVARTPPGNTTQAALLVPRSGGPGWAR